MSVDYEEAYKAAERAYNDAVGNINYCNRRKSALFEQKSEKENRIIFCESEIKRNNNAKDKLRTVAGERHELDAKRQAEMVAIADVSNTYYGSVAHSDTYPKFFAGILNPHDIAVNEKVNRVYAEINNASAVIEARVGDYEDEIRRLNDEIDYVNGCIASNQADLDSYQAAKTNAECNMAYYKSLM